MPGITVRMSMLGAKACALNSGAIRIVALVWPAGIVTDEPIGVKSAPSIADPLSKKLTVISVVCGALSITMYAPVVFAVASATEAVVKMVTVGNAVWIVIVRDTMLSVLEDSAIALPGSMIMVRVCEPSGSVP